LFLLPENCDSGNFVRIDDNQLVCVEQCSDLEDRTLFLTGQCNSNCIMCPYTSNYRSRAEHCSVADLERYIELMDPYAHYLCITGGEPTLLREDFFKLLERVKEHFISISLHILTNGRTFYYYDFLKRFIVTRPYKTLLGVPLHASNAILHDEISQIEGSFEETYRGIKNLLSVGEFVELRVVTSKLNYKDLPELSNFIIREFGNVHHVCFMGLEMMGNSMVNREQVWLPYDNLWPYVRQAVDALVYAGIEVFLFNYPLCIVEEQYWPIYRKSITPSKIEYFGECNICAKRKMCGGFFRTTKIMPDISVYPFLGDNDV